MPPGVPPTPKIGSGGGFAGQPSFLGAQNLPGQSLGGAFGAGMGGFGGGFGAMSSISQAPGLDPNVATRLRGGFDGQVIPGFNFAGGGHAARAQPRQSNILGRQDSAGNALNPFTNRDAFTDAEIAGLNSGQMLFAGRNGGQSLQGAFDPPQPEAGSTGTTGTTGPSGGNPFSELLRNLGGVRANDSSFQQPGQPNDQSMHQILMLLQQMMGQQQAQGRQQ